MSTSPESGGPMPCAAWAPCLGHLQQRIALARGQRVHLLGFESVSEDDAMAADEDAVAVVKVRCCRC